MGSFQELKLELVRDGYDLEIEILRPVYEGTIVERDKLSS